MNERMNDDMEMILNLLKKLDAKVTLYPISKGGATHV
jgi:hypothetical protein